MGYFEEKDSEMSLYLEKNLSSESELLQELREETYREVSQPHMVSGHHQGRFLAMISKMLKPQRILEIGTFTGYATLCLAEGLSENGEIITLDINEELSPMPKKYFERSIFKDKIKFLLKDALEFLEENQDVFDLVFIDADKKNYPLYFEKIKKHLRSGSVVIFDNVLWYGKVLEENPKKKSTKKIKELNEKITQDADFENVILPLRDGLHIMRYL